MNAKELHSFLEIKRDFRKWVSYYAQTYDFTLGEDFWTKIVRNPNEGGRPEKEWSVTLDMAKELCMLAKSPKGKEARRYFIEIEKRQSKTEAPQVQMGEETSRLFNTVLESVKNFSPTATQTLGIKMLEAYGIQVPYNALPLDIEKRWSATEIAREAGEGVTNTRVGRVATALDLKRMPFGQRRMSVAPNSNKEVTMYYYNEKAKDKILYYIANNP